MLFCAGREERLHDYNARKANIAAAEQAMWDEELALHKIDNIEAEAAVYRGRMLDWATRENKSTLAVAETLMRLQGPSLQLKGASAEQREYVKNLLGFSSAGSAVQMK